LHTYTVAPQRLFKKLSKKVVFANRYLQAYYDFKNNQTVSQSWLTSFQVKDKKLTIIQHLIMGMNAHISFDLGIAAEEIAANGELKKMEKDFLKVNEILIEITGEMQDKINRVSKLMFLLDWFGARKDEKVIEFGMVTARDFAWKFAVGLSVIDGKGQPALIQETDQIVADINRHIQRPKRKITHFTLRLVSFFETKNVKKIIQKLKS